MQSGGSATETATAASSGAGTATSTAAGGAPFGPILPPSVVDAIHRLFPTLESQFLGTLLVAALLVGVSDSVRRLGPAMKHRFNDTAVEATQAAVTAVLTGLVGVFFVVVWRGGGEVNALLESFEFGGRDVVRAVFTVTILAGAYSVTRLTRRVIHRVGTERGGISEHQQEIAHHVVQVSVYVFALLVVLGMWGVNIGGLLVGAGFAGIVLGLAARQTLGAVLAGFVVLFSRPFELGDWVEIGDQEGIVTDITIVNTQLRTFDDEYAMIPNDIVTSEEIINRSRQGRLRVNVDVGVDYTTDLETAMELAEEAMTGHDLLLDKPDPHVVLAEFGDSAVVLRLRFYISNPSARKMWKARTKVIAAVKERFDEAGVKIPFPQRELSGRAQTGGLRVADAVDASARDTDGGVDPAEESDAE
ncbi:mechanosensitive ion channel family protein [Halobaculum sp. D14]|uniref:mechanosensitive ion channel family protein n=1 Tax=Halobaculum sp. D14 TaxID=3421642 RepID=UPI003EBE5446